MEALVSDNLKNISGVKHGFFTRLGGVSGGVYESLNGGLWSNDDQTCVQENRKRVEDYLGATSGNLVSCRQIHSSDVVNVTAPWADKDRPRVDGMVTNKQGIALGILTADCGPVLFADESAGVIGAAHAGWRGAVGGILESTILEMEAIGAKRSSIKAAIGPCIWQDSYEVGPEFPAPFLDENRDNRKFFRPSIRERYHMFDLPGYIMAKLRSLGLDDIAPSPVDTLADERRFFSYRRNCLVGEKSGASQISAIMLAG
ncbi:MAG: peptidoglycan editing factor PgeF [Alphaproteobacteria bacterium]|nr:peptidoglycan editing factor PgeF [Alphaproteobacteria bacterium]